MPDLDAVSPPLYWFTRCQRIEWNGSGQNNVEGPIADGRVYKGNHILLLVNQVTDPAMNTENMKRCRDVERKGYTN